MAVFGGYESELVAMAESSRARIEAVAEMAEGTERRALKDAVEASIASAKELLEQMELEVASSARTERAALTARLRARKDEISALQKDLRQAFTQPRRGDQTPPELGTEAAEQRARLLATSERERSNTAKLREAQAALAETEGVGVSILNDLRAQRETLMHSIGTLRGADEMLGRSKRVIATIGRRAFTNKLIMWVMIVVLIIFILALAYLQFFGGKAAAHAAVVELSPPPAPPPMDAAQTAKHAKHM